MIELYISTKAEAFKTEVLKNGTSKLFSDIGGNCLLFLTETKNKKSPFSYLVTKVMITMSLVHVWRMWKSDRYGVTMEKCHLQFPKQGWHRRSIICVTIDLPWLKMELRPDKPTVSWKHPKLKVRVRHLPSQTTQLSRTPLTHAGKRSHGPAVGQSHFTQSVFYNEVLTAHAIYWILYWNWQTEGPCGHRMAVSPSVMGPHGRGRHPA